MTTLLYLNGQWAPARSGSRSEEQEESCLQSEEPAVEVNIPHASDQMNFEQFLMFLLA
jgi:hypothetical protein